MSDKLASLLARLPTYLGGHMLLSVAALAVGLAISVPLGIVSVRRPRLAEGLLGVAGVLQTIPSLALLVLMVPVLGLIGFAPAFAALVLYSILPILAGTIVGIRGVDPTLIEAAQGLGMSPRQVLFRVELPLALPVIVSGVRTATVMTVGTATLATPVGGLSLGNYIFAGLQGNDLRATVFGCVVTAVLAILMDQLVRILEIAARRRSRRLALVGAAGLLLVLTGGLLRPIVDLFKPRPAVVVSAMFTEQNILSEVLADRLQAAGFRVQQYPSMGYTIQGLAFRQNQVDCCVNYSGDVWSTYMGRTDSADRQTTFDEAVAFLREQYGIECLGRLGFENAYALAMPRKRAAELNIHSLADLAKHPLTATFLIGGDTVFFQRPEWPSVCQRYGLQFREKREMDASLMYAAVAVGAVDVICAYTTDGRVLEKDLEILTDPLQAFPPYDAMLLVSARAYRDPRFVAALQPLVGILPAEAMRRANLRVDVEGQPPRQAAAELLEAVLPDGRRR